MVNLIPAPSHSSSRQCNWPIVRRSVLLSGVIERTRDAVILAKVCFYDPFVDDVSQTCFWSPF
jgi:hypothetical protein